ncbi:MAG: type IV conjugative transfer system protein TraE [Syntrophus sp. (in: bacteria)]
MQYNKWIRDWKTALAENFFLRSLCLLLGVGLILNATVFRSKERIIISPPQITKEFWLEANKASPEYLEQMGAFFATLGGNLSPASAEFNVSTLLGYINSPSHAEMKRDLSAQAQYIKKHNITQAYFPSAMNVDRENGVVSVTGEVVRNIGTVRIDKEEMIIRMKFTMDNYKLWLQEFYTEYPGREKEEKKKKGQFQTDIERESGQFQTDKGKEKAKP